MTSESVAYVAYGTDQHCSATTSVELAHVHSINHKLDCIVWFLAKEL